MATQKIVSRWDSSKILFECGLPEGLDSGLAMRRALERACASRANLSRASYSALGNGIKPNSSLLTNATAPVVQS